MSATRTLAPYRYNSSSACCTPLFGPSASSRERLKMRRVQTQTTGQCGSGALDAYGKPTHHTSPADVDRAERSFRGTGASLAHPLARRARHASAPNALHRPSLPFSALRRFHLSFVKKKTGRPPPPPPLKFHIQNTHRVEFQIQVFKKLKSRNHPESLIFTSAHEPEVYSSCDLSEGGTVPQAVALVHCFFVCMFGAASARPQQNNYLLSAFFALDKRGERGRFAASSSLLAHQHAVEDQRARQSKRPRLVPRQGISCRSTWRADND